MEEINRRRTTSLRQLDMLVSFMENHRDFALGRVRSKEARAVAGRLWAECATFLNAEGEYRTPKEWTRFWNDYKCRIRNKVALLNRSLVSTGGGPSVAHTLTALEDRVAALIGKDVGPISGVRRDVVIDLEVSPVLEPETPNSSMPQRSPVSNISLVPDIGGTEEGTGSQSLLPQVQTDETMGETRSLANEDHRVANNLGAAPDPPSRRTRRSIRPRSRSSIHQSSLGEARASIARIEEIRARTDETMAQIQLRQAEAAVHFGQALESIAQSLRTIADSVQAYTSYIERNA